MERELFGAWLQVQRRVRGIRQQDIADAAGVSRGQISHIEAGNSYPSAETLTKIMDFLGYEVASGRAGSNKAYRPATLCWTCHYAYNIERACCWADHLEPRKDWEVVAEKTKSGGDSYYITHCAGYLSDKEWKEREAKKCESISAEPSPAPQTTESGSTEQPQNLSN